MHIRAVLVLVLLLVGHQPTLARGQDQHASTIQIVLVRGLLDVFSTGLDDLAVKLRHQGYENVRVVSWTAADQIASRISSPVVLIGHSLGANSAIEIARRLSFRGIDVFLLVTFDTTEPNVIPANVAYYINVYQQNGVGRLPALGAGFRGKAINYDLTTAAGVSHTNIEKLPHLHLLVIQELKLLTSNERPRATAARTLVGVGARR